jgi:hypothetical protein
MTEAPKNEARKLITTSSLQLVRSYSDALNTLSDKLTKIRNPEIADAITEIQNADQAIYDFLQDDDLVCVASRRSPSANDKMKLFPGQHAGVSLTIIREADGTTMRVNFYGSLRDANHPMDLRDGAREKVFHSGRTDNIASQPMLLNMHLILPGTTLPYYDLWLSYKMNAEIKLMSFRTLDKINDIQPSISTKDHQFKPIAESIGSSCRALAQLVPNTYAPR